MTTFDALAKLTLLLIKLARPSIGFLAPRMKIVIVALVTSPLVASLIGLTMELLHGMGGVHHIQELVALQNHRLALNLQLQPQTTNKPTIHFLLNR